MKIYIFGNPLVAEDSLPIKLIPQLKEKLPKIDFIVCDPNENFPPIGEKDLTIIDTVVGIDRPMVIDFDKLSEDSKTPISPHDYDLLFHLQLLKKMKKINKVKIIGLPVWCGRTKVVDIKNQLVEFINSIILQK